MLKVLKVQRLASLKIWPTAHKFRISFTESALICARRSVPFRSALAQTSWLQIRLQE